MIKNNDIFSGKWMVRYDAAIFKYNEVMERLVDIRRWLLTDGSGGERPGTPGNRLVTVVLDKHFEENTVYYDGEGNTAGLGLPGVCFFLGGVDTNDFNPRVMDDGSCRDMGRVFNTIRENNDMALEKIGLSYPVLLSDKRWETLNLTTS
ncbi:MAG: hypothetical protein GY940_03970, partial [bacterium]|nr:hypothetical protein [bacterium]